MPELYVGTSTPVPHQHFECPACGATHRRGMFGIGLGQIGTYRCLKCGYVGRGYHPDPDLDLDLAREAESQEREMVASGGPFFVGVPPEPPPIGYQPTDDDAHRAKLRGV